MDDTTFNPQQYPTQPMEQNFSQNNGVKKKLVLRILFTVIIIILLIVILNYFNILFNILPLSRLFPNQLGFLPHKAQNRPTSIPQSTETPTNYSSTVFQYDSEKAKIILTQYIKGDIRPEFIPQTLDIKQGLSIDNRQEDLKYQFGTYFTSKQSAISVNFHYKENTNTPNDFIIFIQLSQIDKTPVTPTLANTMATSYFNNPYSPIQNCSNKEATSYCETFRTEDNGKRGYGVIFTDDNSVSPPKFIPIVFTCLVPKESKDYATQKSCISP